MGCIAPIFDPHFDPQNDPLGDSMKHENLKLRGRIYYLRRRVPERYKTVENRNEVLLSLRTDSLEVAKSKQGGVWRNQVEAWEAKLAGDTADAEKKHAAAIELAAVRGLRYMPMPEVLELPTDKLLERVETATDRREAVAV